MALFPDLMKSLKHFHLNYNMITSLYMLEPMERTIINCLVILMLSLMMYSTWVYLPHYTLKLLYFSGMISRPQQAIFPLDDHENMQHYNPEL